LTETDRCAWLQDLDCLATRYVEPLREESFLSDDDLQRLFGNIRDIIQFQKLFVDELQQSLRDTDDVKVHYQNIKSTCQLSRRPF